MFEETPAEVVRSLFATLPPGAHVALFGDVPLCMEARRVGFEVRDTLLMLGSTYLSAFLLRKPVAEATVAAQVVATGTGALNIDACRTGDGRWPTNLILIHALTCSVDEQGSWDCAPTCPCARLDDISGHLKSGAKRILERTRTDKADWRYDEGTTSYADEGGASRFYPQCTTADQAYEWLKRLTGERARLPR
jgi:hypothetical protein